MRDINRQSRGTALAQNRRNSLSYIHRNYDPSYKFGCIEMFITLSGVSVLTGLFEGNHLQL